ncbi:MAG TPA: endonuclease/exonuclease/phosphatase family protein [Acidimicrobiales bacterium]|nr:endonuclease/exonuclease/phosphatase family protein [Acidimicrobiales bacterium]
MTEQAVVRVATFNVRNGRAWDGCNSWPFRRRASAHTLRELDAELIGLQEAFAFQLRWLVRRLPDYDVVGEGRDGNGRGEHCAVLVRRSAFRVIDAKTRWFGGTPLRASRLVGARFPRVATTVELEHVNGQHWHFTSTHLDEASTERRRASATQLAEWVRTDTPHVVVGDFNAPPDAPIFDALLRAGFRHALPTDAGGTSHRFSGRRDGRRIDHVLVNAAVDVRAAHVVYRPAHERLASDHWPVVADVAAG